jgi:hypothetical protein
MDILKSIIQFLLGLFKKSEGTKITTKAETKDTIKEIPKTAPTEVPEVIYGTGPAKVETALIKDALQEPSITTINNSKNFPYYTQRNNEVRPLAACNVTAMVMGLLYNKLIYQKDGKWYNKNGVDLYELNKEDLPHTPYKQLEDNLIWYLNRNTQVLAKYQQTYPNLYDDWVKECDELEKKGVKFENYTLKSYPPNELHLILSYGTSKFIGIEKATNYETQGIETIIRRIKGGESLVVSGVFEGLNHIVCVVGLQYEKETGKVVNFIIDDPYYRTLHYKEKKTGDDSVITYDEFLKFVKPVNNKEKACHIFKR